MKSCGIKLLPEGAEVSLSKISRTDLAAFKPDTPASLDVLRGIIRSLNPAGVPKEGGEWCKFEWPSKSSVIRILGTLRQLDNHNTTLNITGEVSYGGHENLQDDITGYFLSIRFTEGTEDVLTFCPDNGLISIETSLDLSYLDVTSEPVLLLIFRNLEIMREATVMINFIVQGHQTALRALEILQSAIKTNQEIPMRNFIPRYLH